MATSEKASWVAGSGDVAPSIPPSPAKSASTDVPRLSALSCRVFEVPTDSPEGDGTIEWSSTTCVVVQATAGGHTGIGWTYATPACRAIIDSQLSSAVLGSDPMDVPGMQEAMVRACRNLGRPGVVSSAISAVDTALWDLKARLCGLALSALFGRCRPDVPVYGSGGFTTYSNQRTRSQMEHFVSELGIKRVKIKIGESWGHEVARDLERIAFVRKVIGDGVELYVDANGGYTRKQAIRVGRQAFERHGVTWFEEPVSSDDLDGLREVRDHVSQDVAAGEYGYGESYFAHMVAAQAVDCLQIDVTRCGGYTAWLRAAALAGANGLQVSGHCGPALHAQVAGSVPNLRHLEYFHDHERLEALLFDGVLSPAKGSLVPDQDVIGNGYALKEPDALEYEQR